MCRRWKLRCGSAATSVSSPYDGRELDQVATSGADHVDDALAAAHALFRDRDSWLSVPERLDILNKAAA
ncbi:MAG: aldehyde dehydrogenase family protein, partial [Proteobacteria bacterium]|nr:aldehyde dehydrogenase family protein [Pseudomonadota bacterium]